MGRFYLVATFLVVAMVMGAHGQDEDEEVDVCEPCLHHCKFGEGGLKCPDLPNCRPCWDLLALETRSLPAKNLVKRRPKKPAKRGIFTHFHKHQEHLAEIRHGD